jgi:hypothetical protein
MISPFRTGIVPVLTYHSQNIAGNDYASNDQHALASDIQTIIDSGMRVLNLSDLVDWITGKRPARFARNGIVLTCDDAPKFDYEGVVYRDFGLQTSFRSIIQRHDAHITCFAIASPKARAEIGEDALGDAELMTDAWWPEADKARWASIENHGWDHCHPAVSEPVGDSRSFLGVAEYETCRQQVQLAADSIAAVTGRRPTLFAYPFGESSAYLRNSYLPDFENEHGMQAAVSTDAGYATRDSNRWNIPRFICGRDWNSPDGFRAILDHAKRSW